MSDPMSDLSKFHVETFPDGAMYSCFCDLATDHEHVYKTLEQIAAEIMALREKAEDR
jgi:hypothetical protein